MRTHLFPLILLSFAAAAAISSASAKTEPATGSASIAGPLKSILAEKNPDTRLAKLAEWGTALPPAEISKVLAAARELPQLRDRAVLENAALLRWAESAPADALACASELPEGRYKTRTISVILAKFAERDPVAAAAAAAALPAARSRNEAINTVATTWAKTDGKHALTWADSLPPGAAHDSAVEAVLFVWVHIDPVAALPRIQKLPSGDLRNALVMNVADAWAMLDPHAASKWAQGLPEGNERLLALQNVASAWATLDPAAAAEFTMQLPTAIRPSAIAEVAEHWGTQYPDQAAQWLMKNTEDPVQLQGITSLLGFWAVENPVAAERFIASLPAGPAREVIIPIYVRTAAEWAPDLAARQAITIVDPNVRNRQVENCFRIWLQTDPVGARKWLEEAKLPPEVKKGLLAPSK